MISSTIIDVSELASKAEAFADQLASIVTEELDRAASVTTASRWQSKPITRWLSKVQLLPKVRGDVWRTVGKRDISRLTMLTIDNVVAPTPR